jgi:DNA-binding NtrC family response regulator
LPADTILVVASDAELRRSIEFALEAEGYLVSSHARLSDAAISSAISVAACVVVDEDSLQNLVDWGMLSRLTKPTVLLADRSERLPATDAARILFKPLLGNALVETVHDAVPGHT